MIERYIKTGKRRKVNKYLDVKALVSSEDFSDVCSRVRDMAVPFDSVAYITLLSKDIAEAISDHVICVMISKSNPKVWGSPSDLLNTIDSQIIGSPHGRTLVLKYAITDGLSCDHAIQNLQSSGFDLTELISLVDFNMGASSRISIPYRSLLHIDPS